MGYLKKTEWSEEKIQNHLRRYFMSYQTKKYELFGKFVYDWESDYFMITKSGYAYEIEIKISRSDFKHDAKKEHKHLILEGKIEQYERPNYFYYAVPKDLITEEEVPENYGLIYVTEYGLEIVKKAPLLHKEKVNVNNLNLIDKFYYGMWEWRDKYKYGDLEELKDINKQFIKDIEFYENVLLPEKETEIDNLKEEIKKLKEKYEKF